MLDKHHVRNYSIGNRERSSASEGQRRQPECSHSANSAAARCQTATASNGTATDPAGAKSAAADEQAEHLDGAAVEQSECGESAAAPRTNPTAAEQAANSTVHDAVAVAIPDIFGQLAVLVFVTIFDRPTTIIFSIEKRAGRHLPEQSDAVDRERLSRHSTPAPD